LYHREKVEVSPWYQDEVRPRSCHRWQLHRRRDGSATFCVPESRCWNLFWYPSWKNWKE